MRQITHDVLILGTGLAGLRAAVEICIRTRGSADIGIISKVQVMRSHSVCAEGGTGAVMRPQVEPLKGVGDHEIGEQGQVPALDSRREPGRADLLHPRDARGEQREVAQAQEHAGVAAPGEARHGGVCQALEQRLRHVLRLLLAQVKRAYFAALQRHPPHADPDGFRRVRDAYEALSSPEALALAFAHRPIDFEAELRRWDEQFAPRAEAAAHAQVASHQSVEAARRLVEDLSARTLREIAAVEPD